MWGQFESPLTTCRYKAYRLILARQFIPVQLRRTRGKQIRSAMTRDKSLIAKYAVACGRAGEMTDVASVQHRIQP